MNKYQKFAIVILITYPIIFLAHQSKNMKESLSQPPVWEKNSNSIQPIISLLKPLDNVKNKKILVIYNETTPDIFTLGTKSNEQFTGFDFELKYQLLPLVIVVAIPYTVNTNNQLVDLADAGIMAEPTKINIQLYDYVIFHNGEKLVLPKNCIYFSSNKEWLLYDCTHK